MLDRDFATTHKLGKRSVHINHTLLRRSLYHRAYLMRPRFADERAHGVVVNEKFVGWNKPAGNARDESLREDADERSCELHPHLRLLLGRKHVDNAVNGLRGVVGMKWGEDKVPSLGGCHCRGDGLVITHFADHDDVHVFAKGALERSVEIRRINVNFALV